MLAATNRDLDEQVSRGAFQHDLYFRLNVFPIEVPPLRERREDLEPLAAHFLELACRRAGREPMKVSRSQVDKLHAYDWPGNIRELRNVIERAVILSPGSRLRHELAMPQSEARAALENRTGSERNRLPLDAEEMRLQRRANLLAALEQTGWRVSGDSGAARLLGLKPSTLRYQMRAMGIRRPP